MRRAVLSIAVCLVLVAASCGNDASEQERVGDLFLQAAGEQGINVDEPCVRELSAQLSDEDAKNIADAGVEGSPTVSAEADVIAQRVYEECAVFGAYIDNVVAAMTEGDNMLDADCIRDQLVGLSVAEIDEKLFDAAFACTE